MKNKQKWTVSDISNQIRMRAGILEFKDETGEWHDFTLIVTKDRVVFGGVCNTGFIESGYILREEGESLDETLSFLLDDLTSYYNGYPDITRIVYNERM